MENEKKIEAISKQKTEKGEKKKTIEEKMNPLNPKGLARYKEKRVEGQYGLKNVVKEGIDKDVDIDIEQVVDDTLKALKNTFEIDFTDVPESLSMVTGGIRCLAYANKYSVFTEADWMDKKDRELVITLSTKEKNIVPKRFLENTKRNKTCDLMDIVPFLSNTEKGRFLRDNLLNVAKHYETLVNTDMIGGWEAKVTADWIRENDYRIQNDLSATLLDRFAKVRYNARLRQALGRKNKQ